VIQLRKEQLFIRRISRCLASGTNALTKGGSRTTTEKERKRDDLLIPAVDRPGLNQQAEALHEQKEWLRVVLAGIGDAVITPTRRASSASEPVLNP